MAKRTRTNGELPPDLHPDILVRLPVKSLCRFRCVSKLWRSLIDDPHFVEAHHACSCKSGPKLHLFLPCLKYAAVKKKSLVGPRQLVGQSLFGSRGRVETLGVELYSMDYPNQPDPGRIRALTYNGMTPGSPNYRGISQSAGGLYCVEFGHFIRIWNPTTLDFLDLNPMEIETSLGLDPMYYRTINHFGFDPVEKKHKILSLWQDSVTERIDESHVFVLEENCWRVLDDYPSHLVLSEEVGDVICIDGVMFGITKTRHPEREEYYQGEECLVAFHVRSETVQTIPLPKAAQSASLIELEGHLACVIPWEEIDLSDLEGEDEHDDDVNDGYKIRLWILEDLEEQVWRRKTCVIPWEVDGNDLIDVNDCVIYGTPTGELLLARSSLDEPFCLFLYSVQTGALRLVDEFQGLLEVLGSREQELDSTWTVIRFHVESLQALKVPSRPALRFI